MAIRVQRQWIATGDAGIAETLRAMAHIIDGASDDPLVVGFARRLVTTSGTGRTPYGAATVIAAWLARYWRYVDDPTNRELLRDAHAMLLEFDETAIVSGDCDEAAILGASLGMAVGIPAELTVYAFDTGDGGSPGASPYSHVFATLLPDNGQEVTLDVTRPAPGTPVPAIVRSLTVPV